MDRKLYIALIFLLISHITISRLLFDVNTDEDGENLSPSEVEPLEESDSAQELIVRPQNINVSLLQHAFNDTILHLKAEDNIRIRIKVHNKKFLPFFN